MNEADASSSFDQVRKPDAKPRFRLLDLSHIIRHGLVTYPGLPAPTITQHLTRAASRDIYAPGTEFAIDAITMVGNTGTYIDSPYHRYANGVDLSGLSLDTLVDQPAEVFHLHDSAERGIRAASLYDRVIEGRAVLLHTGWDRHFGKPAYGQDASYLTAEAAEYLVEQRVTMVGIDSLNIDDTQSGPTRPVHTILLGAGIHVIEHMTGLDALPSSGATVTAVPPRIEGFGSFPVRVFARVPVDAAATAQKR